MQYSWPHIWTPGTPFLLPGVGYITTMQLRYAGDIHFSCSWQIEVRCKGVLHHWTTMQWGSFWRMTSTHSREEDNRQPPRHILPRPFPLRLPTHYTHIPSSLWQPEGLPTQSGITLNASSGPTRSRVLAPTYVRTHLHNSLIIAMQR